jgi:hypothetical protein
MSAPQTETAHFGGCWKKTYPSRAQARYGDARMPGKNSKRHRRLRRVHPELPCRAYVCPNCAQWHLTSQAKR